MTTDPRLIPVTIQVCDLCLDGVDGECHVPGCAYWMDDAPTERALTRLREAVSPLHWTRASGESEAS